MNKLQMDKFKFEASVMTGHLKLCLISAVNFHSIEMWIVCFDSQEAWVKEMMDNCNPYTLTLN
jgi:hypothetical protein